MERTKLSDEHIALWKAPTIAEQLPVRFDTGFDTAALKTVQM